MAGFLHKLYQFYKKPITKHLKGKIETSPKIELPSRLLQNTQVLSNREVLLEHLPKKGAVVELGVDQGEFSKKILEVNNPNKLFLIDTWNSKRFSSNKKLALEKELEQNIKTGQVQIIQNDSLSASSNFRDNSLDWIYIDTDHSFNTTYAELKAYAPKVKVEGFIAGHDFTQGSFDNIVVFGVIEAVRKFCTEESWELAYLTLDANNYFSFAIKRTIQPLITKVTF
ncbi:MAG: class I SAM-dependent methyltransferase [Bacteroidia bacterium]